MKHLLFLCFSLLLTAASIQGLQGAHAAAGTRPINMTLTSSGFPDGGQIARKYTCEGVDVSPPLAWSGVPNGTQALALIVDDPDGPDPKAPKLTWVHWVVYDIPPHLTGLPEGAALPSGAKAGLNDWQRPDYGGPCPPVGRHRYFFKLFALSRALGDLDRPTKAALLNAMKGHILEDIVLIGTYQKGD
jgi:Raf kinase inhibitor-like YbhB/YbcL family protein